MLIKILILFLASTSLLQASEECFLSFSRHEADAFVAKHLENLDWLLGEDLEDTDAKDILIAVHDDIDTISQMALSSYHLEGNRIAGMLWDFSEGTSNSYLSYLAINLRAAYKNQEFDYLNSINEKITASNQSISNGMVRVKVGSQLENLGIKKKVFKPSIRGYNELTAERRKVKTKRKGKLWRKYKKKVPKKKRTNRNIEMIASRRFKKVNFGQNLGSTSITSLDVAVELLLDKEVLVLGLEYNLLLNVNITLAKCKKRELVLPQNTYENLLYFFVQRLVDGSKLKDRKTIKNLIAISNKLLSYQFHETESKSSQDIIELEGELIRSIVKQF